MYERSFKGKRTVQHRTGSTKINQSEIREAKATAVKGMGIPAVKKNGMGGTYVMRQTVVVRI